MTKAIQGPPPQTVPVIRRVTIERFKRFESEVFELRPFNLLVGPNNHGKSTLLQALSAWQLAYQFWHSARKTGPGPISKNLRGVPIPLPIFHSVPLTDFKHLWFGKRTQWFDKEAYDGRKRTASSADPGPAYQGRHDVNLTVEWEAGPGHPHSFGMRLQYENEQSIMVKPTPDTKELPESIERIVLTHIPPFSGLDPTEEYFADGAIRRRIGLSQPGSVVRNLLWRVYKSDDKSRWAELCRVVKRFLGVELREPKFAEQVDPHITCEYVDSLGASRESFDLVNGGSGFHQLLTIFAILFWNRGTHLLLDEPDAHLHAWAQAGVVDYLRDQARRGEAQIIIATHSTVMLDRSQPEDVCSLMEAKPIWLVSDKQKAGVLSGLDSVETSLLTFVQQVPLVLYVEGTRDLELLRLWAKVLGKDERLFERLPVHKLDGRDPKQARHHFLGVRSFRPDVAAICVLDPDADRAALVGSLEHHREPGLEYHVWQRRHIESYLLVPPAFGRAVHGSGDLLAGATEASLRAFLQRPPRGHLFPENIPSFRSFDLDWMRHFDAKCAIFSPATADASFIVEEGIPDLTPERVAQAMLPDEVHEDVVALIEHIYERALPGVTLSGETSVAEPVSEGGGQR